MCLSPVAIFWVRRSRGRADTYTGGFCPKPIRLWSCNWVFYHHCNASHAVHLHLNQSDSICTVVLYFIFSICLLIHYMLIFCIRIDVPVSEYVCSSTTCVVINSIFSSLPVFVFRGHLWKANGLFSPLVSSRQEANSFKEEQLREREREREGWNGDGWRGRCCASQRFKRCSLTFD